MRQLGILCLLMILALTAPVRAAVPIVAASVKPVHSLVAAVMAGVGEPELIIKGAESPHAYVLKPSDAQLLARADVVFWIGPFEITLAKALTGLAGKAEITALAMAPGMNLRMSRQGDLTTIDGHAWLDIDNAKAMTRMIALVLAERDRTNSQRYQDNAATALERLDRLDGALRAKLAPISARPFVVYHDGYQYFEKRYGLAQVGYVALDPERPPGARRIAELQALIQKTPAICVFSEPDFRPKLMEMLGGGKARTGVLDPEGTHLSPGPNMYFELLTDLADNLTRCLSPR